MGGPFYQRFSTHASISISDDADYALGFEQLLRWCFDKPLYVEPELGQAPAFSDQQAAPVVTRALPFERVLRDPSAPADAVVSTAVSFLRELNESSIDFTIQFGGDEPEDEQIVKAVEGLSPIISRVIKVLDRGITADQNQLVQAAFHRYLERIIPFLDSGPTGWSGDVTKFYAQFIFVSFVALAVRNRRFTDAEALLSTPFVKEERGAMTATSVGYEVFRAYLKSLEARNNRWQLNRTSLQADVIRQVCEAVDLPFREYVEADVLLYLRGAALGHEDGGGTGPYIGWWPTSAIYIADRHSALPSFVRAEHPGFRDKLLGLIGISSVGQLEKLVEQFRSGSIQSPKWSAPFSRMDIPALMNSEKLLASYG